MKQTSKRKKIALNKITISLLGGDGMETVRGGKPVSKPGMFYGEPLLSAEKEPVPTFNHPTCVVITTND